MAQVRVVKKIGILNHVGNGNLGDEATVAAVIQNIKRRFPTAEIYGFSINPDDTKERHCIPTYPLRSSHRQSLLSGLHGTVKPVISRPEQPKARLSMGKARWRTFPPLYNSLRITNMSLLFFLSGFQELYFLLKSFNILRGFDLLIVAGSGQLFDYFGGAWGYPYTFLKWALLAKTLRIPFVFLSVGAGPIASSLSRAFIKFAVSLASYCSYRDESSRRLIEELGCPGDKPVFPDLVYSLQVDSLPPSGSQAKRSRVIGINAIPFFDPRFWPEKSSDIYKSYIGKLALFALWLIQKNYTIIFLPTQVRADLLVIDDIKAIMQNYNKTDLEKYVRICRISGLDDLIEQIRKTDIVVASRFHGILISYLLNKPVLGISYHEKVKELMTNIGESDNILDIKDFDLTSLKNKFLSIQSKVNCIKMHIPGKVSEYRKTLDRQYDHITNIII